MKTIFWVIILLILAGALALGLKKTTEAFEPNIEIVVSRYNEDLEWLKSKKFRYPTTIYNKGTNDNFYKPKGCKIVKLPNVGRESHTYLYHVVNQYDTLPNLTIFLPGSADDKRKINFVNKVIKSIESDKQTTFPAEEHGDIKNKFYNFQLDNWESTHVSNKKANTEKILFPSKIRPFGKWYEAHFDKNVKYSGYAGIFAVSDTHIKQYGKEYYENLIKELEVSSNPEIGHYFERAWVAVFGVTENANFV
jgi:hypothetical protein